MLKLGNREDIKHIPNGTEIDQEGCYRKEMQQRRIEAKSGERFVEFLQSFAV